MKHPALFAAGLIAACGSISQAQWSLHWADEFDGSNLDLSKWEFMIGNGGAYGNPGWGNNELQYYTNFASNLSVGNGTMKITAIKTNFGGQEYTSARIRTINRLDFKWGRVEARIKLPSTSGVWPAFWMLPTDSPYGGWASSGEIDIMESVNNADRIYGTLHHGGQWPQNQHTGSSIATGIDYSQDFHVYAIEWDPNEIRWYLDGTQFGTKITSDWFSSAASSNPRAPFDSNFHLLLNVAVGGNFPGNPNGSAQWPQTMEVDWVRVFRREQRAFEGTIRAIPGQIEAEHYDEGYPGEAYSDSDPGNNGFAFRQDDVDVQTCSEGGYNVGWTRNGEWIEYTANVQAAGTYLVEARVATPSPGGSFRLEVDGENRTGSINVPNTGGWQNWTTVSGEIYLDQGVQTIRFAKNDSPNDFNINWFRFTQQGGCSLADLAEPYGSLNFFDVAAFIGLYNSQNPAADLASPFGVFNFFDVAAYINQYNAGCP